MNLSTGIPTALIPISVTLSTLIIATYYDVISSTYISAVFNLEYVEGGKRNLLVDSIYKLDALDIIDVSTPPYISKIEPSYSYNDTNPIISIFGGYFVPSMMIKVIKDDYEFNVDNFNILSSTSIVDVVLPLKGKEPGVWIIRAINPQGRYFDFYGFNLLKFEQNVKIISPVIDNNNTLVKIKYKIEKPQNISIKVYDARGRYIKTIYMGPSLEGIREVAWNGTDENGRKVRTGIYIVEIKSESYSEYKRVVVIR